MPLKLFNTLTQKVEEFVPIKGRTVRMYTCGPTVYDYVHIGNLRTFIVQDILRRYLVHCNYEVMQVMNITDVEDKIIAGAAEQGIEIEKYTEPYKCAFLEDMKTLKIGKPQLMPQATDHVPEMLDLIKCLTRKGLTYERNGSIYFRIGGFPDYGRLSGIDIERLSEKGQQDSDEYAKENPRDFVLWKKRKPGEAYWDSKLGRGRPGWHLECSAMSMKYLGENFDIHCGGIDLIFPHHENEIAQSEGATGKPFVKYWIHSAHLIVAGEKMSKSRGNFYTLRDLLGKGYASRSIRYLLASVRYRTQLNFTLDGLHQAAKSLERVSNFLQKVRKVSSDQEGSEKAQEHIEQASNGFKEAMDNDLNTAKALGVLFTLIRKINPSLENGLVGASQKNEILELFTNVDQIFDVFEMDKKELQDQKVQKLIMEREEARKRQDYNRADEIRDELASLGIILEDTQAGPRWKRSR